MDARLEMIRSTLESYIGELLEQAEETARRFKDYTVKENGVRKKWGNQNTLLYRVRRENNSLTLEWYHRAWRTDANGNRDTRHHYIRKRNKNKRGTDLVYGYDMDDLFKFAPEWSRDRVVEVEAEAKSFRRQAHYCASMLIILGRLERYLAELEGVKLPEGETA